MPTDGEVEREMKAGNKIHSINGKKQRGMVVRETESIKNIRQNLKITGYFTRPRNWPKIKVVCGF